MNEVEISIVAKDMTSKVIDGIMMKLTDLGTNAADLAAYGGIASLGMAMLDFEMKSVDATVAFSDGVQEMKNIMGGTNIEAARMLDLFDRFGLSAGDAQAAARKLAQEGLTLDIDTLKLLAQQFQAIEDPAERQKFLLDNLGRSGFQYAEMLSLSNTRLDEFNNSLTEGQILVSQNREKVLEYKFATDELGDSWESVKMTLGMGIIPELTSALNWVNKNTEAIKKWGGILYNVINPAHALAEAIHNLINSLINLNQNWGATAPFNPTRAGGRASGGWAGGMTLVGEQGPEVVNLPQGSYVHSSGASAGMRSVVNNFNFPNYIGTRQDLESAMRDTVRRMQLDGSV